MTTPEQAAGPGPTSGARGGRPQPGGLQPLRAVAIVVLAVVVGLVVLARMSPSPSSVVVSRPTRAARSVPTTVGAATTTTTVPTTTTTTVAPTNVRVLVLNGYTKYHAALYYKNKLAALGYDTLAPMDAITSTNMTSTIFVVTPSDRANALALARSPLGLPASDVVAPTPANDAAVPAARLHLADLILLVGADISSRVPVGYNG
ncbi:MAG: hypothetical protein ACP5VR_08560 [Acidimicrobiales bacterium]